MLFILNLQVPLIEGLESRMNSLLKQRADRLIERRQKDVQDQAENFAAAQTGSLPLSHFCTYFYTGLL